MLFGVFDISGNGVISNRDAFRVCRAFSPWIEDSQLQRLVDRVFIEADKDGDQNLSFKEFSDYVESRGSEWWKKMTISWS